MSEIMNRDENIHKGKGKKKLPFYIFLGHLDEVTEKLGEDESNQIILEDKVWILVKNQGKRLIWIVESAVKNLKNSFMMYKDPQIYIFFNYHVKDMMIYLEEELERANTLGDFRFNINKAKLEKDNQGKLERYNMDSNKGDRSNITLLGFNYNGKKPKMRKIREEVIEWCSQKNIPKYTEFDIDEDINNIFD